MFKAAGVVTLIEHGESLSAISLTLCERASGILCTQISFN